MKTSVRFAILFAAFGAATPAFAGFYDYTGDTTDAPTFNRPLQDGSGLSAVGTAVHYNALTFTADQAGIYTFLSTATSNDGFGDPWDTFLILYRGTFDPSDGLANFVEGNDDAFLGTGASQFFTTLTAGQSYTLVTTGFDNDESFGTYYNQIAGPGTIALVPEPASMAALGLGAVGLLRRRKRA